MSLRETKQDILDELEQSLGGIAASLPASELGEAFEDAARGLEALACCRLLLDLDVERFHRDLVWAGYARRRFLQRSREQKNDGDLHLARSRCNSFFCAIAAGDLALAGEIAALSPVTWIPEGEYEDDFAYFRFFQLLLEGAGASETGPVIDQMKAAQGKPSPRLAIITAFQSGVAADFEAAFTDLLDTRNSGVDAERKLFSDEPTYGPRAEIFVEGLALLRLAEVRRLGPARREYPRCPYAARATAPGARPEDIFDELGA